MIIEYQIDCDVEKLYSYLANRDYLVERGEALVEEPSWFKVRE